MINNILVGLGIIIFGYILYRLFVPSKLEHDIEQELDEVVKSDKYKVKGQYD